MPERAYLFCPQPITGINPSSDNADEALKLFLIPRIYFTERLPARVAGKVEDRMMTILKVTGLLLAASLVMTMPASAHGRFGRGIVVVPTMGAWNWYYPFFGPYLPYGSYPLYPDSTYSLGELKLRTNVKDADVYINGAYAGKAAKLKSMWLRPETYNLELRAAGYVPFSMRVYLVPGKTMHIDANLASAPQSQTSHG
jgi:hypothetical protein